MSTEQSCQKKVPPTDRFLRRVSKGIELMSFKVIFWQFAFCQESLWKIIITCQFILDIRPSSSTKKSWFFENELLQITKKWLAKYRYNCYAVGWLEIIFHVYTSHKIRYVQSFETSHSNIFNLEPARRIKCFHILPSNFIFHMYYLYPKMQIEIIILDKNVFYYV